MDTDEFDARIRAVPDGGITSAQGFRAAGVHAGFRRDPARPDLALVVADDVCSAAAVFTRNAFCAAPVRVSRAHLGGASRGHGTIRGVVINSGNANAATGEPGMVTARETCDIASQVMGCEPEQVLVASTGVIGQPLDIGPFETGVPDAFDRLSRDGGAMAARAIMTTDTNPKEYAVLYRSATLEYVDRTFTVGGMCKGSGMIMPDMATMIACITTDAPIGPAALHAILAASATRTFNKITVDSDTSTNDTCILLASGAAAPDAALIEQGSDAFEELSHAVFVVCEALARSIAVDGEGASRLVTVNVTGAATPADADTLARAVANSPLVKTAIAGRDCNWGRVAMALGKCGALFRQEDVAIDIMGIPVCRGGLAVPFDEREARRRFESSEIVISADVGAGSCATRVWTCDLTSDYVKINGDYRT
ncbi:N-acetylglutamate synthase; glutamate N-acetyltransferase [Coriobacterium glomerans PW2]|uniref:Arginine biosynthesis bifunctional protein ArgJ n=1 Tax=Coriobacterium glomerans (strain ATCC 49209 / DSM 20642 / JCM 10262 / PW2) TaxID=700015 RepID=F2NAQ6_CORGP|nr:bifunctional glutamate N-acetyltransferase/amino-acid acetyltransferase ArgJ [Coriobacterium glomerans]AEB07512.1 N-acetylglutamate synthase; glutamate N-acetyltransferase [Coriobacterium glomerans PW2]